MWHFFKGYVILQAEGAAIARFLRRLSQNGIHVMHMRQVEPGVVRFSIDLRRFFDLHRLRIGLPVRVHIIERHGVPFVLGRLRKRPVLWIGTLLVVIALFFASQRIWMIRIEGNETIDEETILSLLNEHDLYIGARPKGPVLITAANDLSARIREAAWIGLDREGITLKVRVIEATPEKEKRSAVPSDLVADKEGVITEINVMHGQACVKVGDTVKAGDVLISGTMIWNETVYQTWADGTVRCAVRYESECEVVPTVTEAIETDRTEVIRELRIGPWTLFRSGTSFEQYRIVDERTVPVGDRFPTCCVCCTVNEIVLRERTLDTEEAEQLALINAREAALAKVPKDAAILNQYGTIRTKDGKAFAVVIVTAEETIGRTEEISNDG